MSKPNSMKDFKIRCSAIGQIMCEIGLTDNQLKEIETLKSKPKITEKQKEKLDKLIYKRDNPTLPKTLTSFLDMWIKEQVYKRRKHIKSKYLIKGHECELESIGFLRNVLNEDLEKNSLPFENSFLTGEPDIISKDTIDDVKNSWDFTTFPLLEKEIPNIDYWWQLQGYMCLTGRRKARLIYLLTDTPDHLIEKEATYRSFEYGYDALDYDIEQECIKELTYPDIPNERKYKIFKFDYDQDAVKKIEERVLMCRKYIEMKVKEHNLI
jgi:hypothetical protein